MQERRDWWVRTMSRALLWDKKLPVKVIAKEFIYSVKVKKHLLQSWKIYRSSFVEVHVIIGRYIYGRFCIQKHHVNDHLHLFFPLSSWTEYNSFTFSCCLKNDQTRRRWLAWSRFIGVLRPEKPRDIRLYPIDLVLAKSSYNINKVYAVSQGL